MEFYNIKKADLVKFAEEKGIEVADGDTVPDIDAKLVEANFSRDDYEAYVNNGESTEEPVETDEVQEQEPVETTEDEEEPVKAEQNKVLVRMDRGNAGYRVGSYHFTKAHPFVIMDREDADKLVNGAQGFHIASADEAERYYR